MLLKISSILELMNNKQAQPARISPKLMQYAIAGVIALVALIVIGYTVQSILMKRASARIEALANKGLTALATEEVDCYKNRLAKTEKGCNLMIATYFRAQKGEKLEWAAQKCISNGFTTAFVILGHAASKEMLGRDPESFAILSQLLQSDDKIPEAHFRIAKLYQRSNMKDLAAESYMKSARLAPKSPEILNEVIAFLADNSKWKEAREVAGFIKLLEGAAPGLKLLAARTLKKAGASGDETKVLVEQAVAAIKDNKAEKARLEKMFPELF